MVLLECNLRVQLHASHRVVALLNETVLAPTFAVAVGVVFFLCTIAAPVFPWSKDTLFPPPGRGTMALPLTSSPPPSRRRPCLAIESRLHLVV